MNRLSRNSGFTLLELMIVVAIIGILASVSLPAYQSYITRAKIAEAISLAGEIKPKIIEYYREKGRFPKDNFQAGVPEAKFLIGNYVSSISVDDGAVNIVMGNKVSESIKGKVLTIRPIVVIGSPASPISWVCGDDPAPEGMEPIGDNQTSLENPYLPSSCRE